MNARLIRREVAFSALVASLFVAVRCIWGA